MENGLDSTLFREELGYYGLNGDGAELIREKDGVIVARVPWKNGTAVLKCFEDEAFRRKIRNYGILRSCDIPTIEVLGQSERSILLEDIDASDTWRLGAEEDFENPEVIRAIAKWYKTLHTNGMEYVREHGAGMYEEWDSFTRENIEALREKFSLQDSEGLKAITRHFEAVRNRMDAAPRTLTYNDFYYTNMVVRKDHSAAMMFDYNLLGKGNCVNDIRNVTYWFSEENKQEFFSVYGKPDEELMLLDRITSPVVTLCSAMNRDIFPEWAEEAVGELAGIPKLIAELKG
jgi:Phosphotransferase enzyme family.